MKEPRTGAHPLSALAFLAETGTSVPWNRPPLDNGRPSRTNHLHLPANAVRSIRWKHRPRFPFESSLSRNGLTMLQEHGERPCPGDAKHVSTGSQIKSPILYGRTFIHPKISFQTFLDHSAFESSSNPIGTIRALSTRGSIFNVFLTVCKPRITPRTDGKPPESGLKAAFPLP